jgi:sigma-B regulation protein RsbU (phosphoserine phosphatase)
MSSVHHRRRIALLVNDVFSAYQASFRASIERAARRRNFSLLVFMGRELAHRDVNERAQNAIYDWISPEIADGALVLSGTIANFTDIAGMAGLCERLGAMPVVSIGLSIPGFAAVVLDNRSAQAVAVEHLIRQHRRRRIAYIGGPPSNGEASDRLSGYLDTLKRNDLAHDDRLISAGHFTLPTGREAMREILDRGVDFDSVVAANDHMALGAMALLSDRGIRVPEDVLVVGFDDTPIARFATRSLTTVAQPIDQMVEAGISDLLHLMGAEETSVRPSFDAELVLRESCGCGYMSVRSAQSPNVPEMNATEYLRAHREDLAREMQPSSESTSSGWRTSWAPRLLDGLVADLGGKRGAFAELLERTTEEALAQHSSLEEIGHVIVRLQRHFDAAGYYGAAQFDLEQLWMKARTIVTAAISRKEARAALEQIERSVDLRYVTQRLSIAFESRSLAAELERSLPALGVDTAYVALQPKNDPETLRPLVVLEQRARATVALQPHTLRQLLPDGFPKATEWSLLIWAVTFESEVLGVLALGGAADPLIGEAVRAQIGAALKMGELHARVVEQTAIQERIGREQLMQEMSIARRIQTALAPKDLDATALDIAAGTTPADVVGGDYYDVLPVPGGCWLAIGDVAGHGLMSGLVMLMIQSIVSTLVTSRPDASPSELVVDANRVLFPNLHTRLQRQEHATFALLRVFDDGRISFAGAHEDFIVWRASTRRCELVSTDGTWLGLVEDIRPVTSDRELRLVPGDLLVLLTDGILEARNARNEHFGVDPVCRIIETHADATPQIIHAELIAAACAWAPVQQDDVTCVVVRFTGFGLRNISPMRSVM